VLGYLAERGVPAEQLDRVRVPAGLDLGSTTHQEIAVAILAELVALRADGTLSGMVTGSAGSTVSSASRQAAAERPKPPKQAAQAIDPVCGMTVTASRSGHPLEHDGVTYYFCSTGCRQAFETDPAAYARKETRC
jgi:xanthine dehydrogenase accessory factor